YRCEKPRDLRDLYSRSRGEGFGAEVKRRIMTGTYVLSAGYYDAYYLKAQRVRQLINADFTRAFASVDVLMGPTTPTPAFAIHAQLATRAKISSGSATAYGAPPNAQASLVDLGYPGVLPVLNAEAVRMAVKLGLAINARIAGTSVFARKNYFYPDLPKGYQISQYEQPIVAAGALDIVLDDGEVKRIGIIRTQ